MVEQGIFMKISNIVFVFAHLFFLIGTAWVVCACDDSKETGSIENDTGEVNPTDTSLEFQNDSDSAASSADTGSELQNTDTQSGPSCGNGDREYGEECDDGNTVDGDGCQGDCKEEICGNGRLERVEECDDGNTNAMDECDANCKKRICGNGRVDFGEECDDAIQYDDAGLEGQAGCFQCKWLSDDGCGSCPLDHCSAEPMEADTPLPHLDTDVNVNIHLYDLYGLCHGTIDGGPDGGVHESSDELKAPPCSAMVSCILSTGCAVPDGTDATLAGRIRSKCYCGEGVALPACYTIGAEGPCRDEIAEASQSVDPTIIDTRLGDLTYNSGLAISLLRCVEADCGSCFIGSCGDGTVQQGEECDDANKMSGDGCSKKCEEEVCGNGRIDINESCDYGAPQDDGMEGSSADRCVDCDWNIDCVTCRDESCGSLADVDFVSACLEVEGETASQCAAAAECIEENGCASTSLRDCYCGRYVPDDDCFDPAIGPSGPCHEEIGAASGSAGATEVLDILANPDLSPLGHAVQLMKCDEAHCAMCFGSADLDADVDGDADTDSDTDGDIDIDEPVDMTLCAPCEEEHCTWYDLIYDVEGIAETNLKAECFEGATAQACSNVITCMRDSHCALEDESGIPWENPHPRNCYCGSAEPMFCMAGMADGECMAEIEEAAETTDPMTLAERFMNTEFAIGDAAVLAICEIHNCDVCL